MCRSGRVGPTRRSMNSFPSLPGPGLVLWGCGPGKGRGGEASWVERRSRDQGREAQPRGGPPRHHEEPLILLGLQRCPEGANLHVYGQLDPGSPPQLGWCCVWQQGPLQGSYSGHGGDLESESHEGLGRGNSSTSLCSGQVVCQAREYKGEDGPDPHRLWGRRQKGPMRWVGDFTHVHHLFLPPCPSWVAPPARGTRSFLSAGCDFAFCFSTIHLAVRGGRQRRGTDPDGGLGAHHDALIHLRPAPLPTPQALLVPQSPAAQSLSNGRFTCSGLAC